MPRFSIIIPTCNGQKHIAQTLQSALAQTYPHFTVTVLESGSDDRTIDIVHSCQDPRVQLLSDSRALGIEANWARILDLDLEEYLTILGHDDVLYPDFLQTIAALIDAYPDASLYQTQFDLLNGAGEVLRHCKAIPLRQSGNDFLFRRHQFQQDSFATGYVTRSSDYKRIGGFTAQIPKFIGSDDLAWYTLANLSYKACSPATCFGYRYHEGSTSYSIDLHLVYVAFLAYEQLLQDTPYFNRREHRAAAHNYFQKSLNGRHHRLLADLIATGTPEQWQHYEEDKRRLLQEAARNRGFEVYDLLARLLEAIARLPRPVRHPVIALVDRVGDWTRSLRKH